MAYQPKNGDHITITRTLPGRWENTWTGVVHEDADGFLLVGADKQGRKVAMDIWDAAILLREFHVIQTIQPD
ncbi:hypothetical protein [Streptomyces sp. NPDC097640]|uniref:hypothetical protein n=1 Tax=Streptomyces sp. NPDC097640 TaxID=3157229 RepID=UPI003324AD48